MTFRFYRSVRIGDGLTTRTAFRNKLDDAPFAIKENPAAGTGYWDLIHDARAVRYVLVQCSSSLHTTIAADSEIIPLSPELADAAAIQTWLDGPLGTPTTVLARLEADGISTAWITAQTTRRDMFRYVSRVMACTQDLRRLKDVDALAVFAASLDATVNTLSTTTRTRAVTWMQNRGLDTSWIVPSTTTVRQVIHFVVQSGAWPILAFRRGDAL